jgi:hypothetical protein
MRYAKKQIEGIVVYNELPEPYKNYYDFKNEKPEIIEAEGFLELIENDLIEGEKYGEIYQKENKYYKSVINIDQESFEKSLEEEKQWYLKRKSDGENAYLKLSAEFRLAKLSGQISEAIHSYLEELLTPVRNEVMFGQWKKGLSILEDLGFSQIGEDLYNKLHLQITIYINENY